MKMYIFENEEISLEWIEKDRRFGIWLDDKQCGWYLAERFPQTEDENCGYIESQILEKLYLKIGKILGK